MSWKTMLCFVIAGFPIQLILVDMKLRIICNYQNGFNIWEMS